MKIGALFLTKGVGGTATWSRGLLRSLSKKGVQVQLMDVHSLFLVRQKFDVLHLATTAPSISILALARRLAGTRIVFTLHGDYKSEFRMSMSMMNKFKYTHAWNAMLALSDITTSPSRFLQDMYGIDVMIPNGVDLETFDNSASLDPTTLGCKQGDYIVLSVYNLDSPWRLNAVTQTIEVFRRFVNYNPRSHLLIAGGGKYLSWLASLVKSSEPITFLGQRLDMNRVYKTANALLHTTLSDNLPYAVLEAMASSIPVVSAQIGGIPELVTDGRNGFLSTTGIEGYFSALAYLSNNTKAAVRMGKMGRDIANKYDWSGISSSFTKLYSQLMTR